MRWHQAVKRYGVGVGSSYCCGTGCSILIAKLFAFWDVTPPPIPPLNQVNTMQQASFRVKKVIFVDIKKMDHIPHLCPSEAEDELHVEKSKIIYNLS